MSDRIDGGARAFVCGRSGGSARIVRFLGNTSVVLTWAGTGRVDISVQLACWSASSYCYIINAGLNKL